VEGSSLIVTSTSLQDWSVMTAVDVRGPSSSSSVSCQRKNLELHISLILTLFDEWCQALSCLTVHGYMLYKK